MKFKIKKEIFEKEIERTSNGIFVQGNSPLSGYYLKATREGLSIISTNGELSFKSFIDSDKIDIIEVGICLIDGFFLKNIIKKSENFINFEIKSTEALISWENASFSKVLKDHTIFPGVNFDPIGIKVKVNAKELKKAIKNTHFAASSNVNSPILSSINIKSQDNILIFSATDTNRFASDKISISEPVDIDVSINSENLKNFIPSEVEGEIELFVSENKVNFTYDNLTIQTKVLNVPYKDISNVIPKPESLIYRLKIEKKEILSLIDKATVIAPGKDSAITFHLSKKEITASISKQETGQSKVKSDKVIKYSGEDVLINVNFKYLKDAISVFGKDINIFVDERKTRILIISEHEKTITQLVGLVLKW
ncbi:DNA polymerase III subunit beta [Mesomycoplasma conjunctivae]|uniref:DNA polymerase III subunit beta n=1 Tax=Mesomycoplasma conjunctivae TaxID=45361 RepID=UPI003DA3B090